MAKYYAVINGHSIKEGILTSWDACKKEVAGAKGVIYKSFPTQEEAREFLRLHGKDVPSKETKSNLFLILKMRCLEQKWSAKKLPVRIFFKNL